MPRVAKWVGDAMESLMAYRMPLMKVVATDYINPNIKKIRFYGNLTGMNFQLGYAVLIRVNNTEFRNYTASFSDVKKGILEIIFHIHGNGPGSHFANRLVVGDDIRISMPRGKKQYDSQVKQQLVFGDETSLGLACAFLPFLRESQHLFHFYFDLDAENKDIPHLLGLENYTVFPEDYRLLNDNNLSELALSKSFVWQDPNIVLVGNVKLVQAYRRILKREKNVGKIFAKGYWLEGKKGL